MHVRVVSVLMNAVTMCYVVTNTFYNSSVLKNAFCSTSSVLKHALYNKSAVMKNAIYNRSAVLKKAIYNECCIEECILE